jgi:tetratricopeptide (TPR) repeat protein
MPSAAEARRPALRAGLAVILIAVLCTAPAFAQVKPDALKLYKEGKHDEARAVCLSELSVNPGNIESYVVLVWSLLSLQRWADAELYASKAYNTIRKDPRIVEALGEAAFYQGKNAEAIAHFVDYINLLPDGSRIGTVYYLMGETYLRLVRPGHADIAMRTALQFEPRNAKWWTRLGYVRETASDWSYAIEAYDTALAIDPGLVDAIRGKDRVLSRTRQ